MTSGERREASVARHLWQTIPRALVALAAAWVALALGQPALAWSLQRLVEAALTPASGHGIASAVLAALVTAILGQALYQSYLLRIEILDRAGLDLATRVLDSVARRTGLDHLEDSSTLDRIRVALEGWAVIGALTGSIQLLAVVAGLVLTVPLLGAAAGAALLLIPLCIPLVVAAVWSFRVRVRGMEAAADADRAAERILVTAFDPAAACELRIAGAVGALLEEYRRQHEDGTRLRARSQVRAAGILAAAWTVFIAGFAAILAAVATAQTDGPAVVVPMIAMALQLQGIAVVMVNGSTEAVRGRQVARAQKQVVTAVTPRAESGSSATPPPVLRRGLSLHDVSFTYPNAKRPALAHIDLDIPAGSVVALVGAHGSGKSTLVKLLLRLYEPTTGRIEVDGMPLASFDVDHWRSRTTACFQDFLRIPGALVESVGVGDLTAADRRSAVHEALSRAGAGALAGSLPAGVDTVLGPPGLGTELSGGQWQRVALARGFMRADPLLVVLDEPTASFDPVGEKELFDRNAEFAREVGAAYGTITLAVAHRYATVQSADLIVVLDRGELLEHGTHEELCRKGGVYAGAYERQRAAHL